MDSAAASNGNNHSSVDTGDSGTDTCTSVNGAAPPPTTTINSKSGSSGARSTSGRMVRQGNPPKKSQGLCVFHRRKTWVLRFIFILSLIIAAVICGIVAFQVISNLESDLGSQTYESVATMALEGARAITLRKLKGAQLMAQIMAHTFRDAEAWPFIALPGFVDIASLIADMAQSTTVGTNMIVLPKQAAAFEAHAKQTYQDQNYPETAGVSDFGFGIWSNSQDPTLTHNATDGRYHDVSGNTTYGSKYNIISPIFQHSNVNATSLMFNVHGPQVQGSAIDAMLDCSADAAARAALSESSERPHCGVVTGYIELIVRPGPAALLYYPIYPANDPTTMVALAGTTILWEEVLTNIVPNYVDGLICVISNDEGVYTYEIRGGDPFLLGEGDLHDPEYSADGHSVTLNDIPTDVKSSKSYILTVYPSNMMLQEFRTNSPTMVAAGFVAVILCCAVFFFLYDFFMREQSRRRSTVLEIKRKFVRFISHEIRNPLNTVYMGLELLQDEQKSETCNAEYCQELTNDIMENVNNATNILTDLLNYDKIETGTFRLEIEPISIWRLVPTVVSSFQIEAAKKNIMLSFVNAATQAADEEKRDLDRLIVVGDDTRLRQILRNLLSNSIKFSKEGGKIQVTIRHLPKGLPKSQALSLDDSYEDTAIKNERPCPLYTRAGSALISVRDFGAGLSKEQLGLLFNEGIQFDVNRLQAGGGSGLGLHISKGLAEQHGGTLIAASDGLDRGSTFTIELPLYDYCGNELEGSMKACRIEPAPVDRTMSSYVATAEGTSSESASSNPTPVEKSRKVLVVEDVDANRKLLVRLLERAGHTTGSAVNGQEAIDMYLSEKGEDEFTAYDTILMDYEMPVLNGPDAAAKLREKGCKALIIGVTGNALEDDVKYFKSQGADGVLAKPVKMQLLNDLWSQLTEGQRR